MHKRQVADHEVPGAAESSFGCGHMLLLELAGWIVIGVVGAVVRPLLTTTVVLVLVAIGIIVPLAASVLLVIRDRRRRRSGRSTD